MSLVTNTNLPSANVVIRLEKLQNLYRVLTKNKSNQYICKVFTNLEKIDRHAIRAMSSCETIGDKHIMNKIAMKNAIKRHIEALKAKTPLATPIASSSLSKTQITIGVWNPKKKEEDSGQVFKHLDIGSSNYGPESSRRKGYRHSSSDSSGLKIHRVLFCNLDHVLETHSNYKKFTFYLNDISSKGLDKAALNLADHLRKKNKDKNLKIKIVKIVKDIFKLSPFPTVDSASFIYPFDVFFGRIMMSSHPDVVSAHVTDLFLKVTSASKTGLLVKESNMSGGMADAAIDAISEGFMHKGLKFECANTGFIPQYTFPSGKVQTSSSVSYLVTKIT